MNGYERVMSCVMGKETDRPPVSGLLSLYGAKLINASTTDYYQKPELYIEGQRRVIEVFNPDIIFTPFALALEAQVFGCNVIIPNQSFPYITKRPFESIKQIYEIDMGHLDMSVYFDYFLKVARRLSELYKGQKAIGGFWMDPYDLLLTVVGPELFVECCLFNQSDFNEIIEKFTEHSLWVANKYLEAGVDFLVVPGGVCNSALLTKRMIEEIVLSNLGNVFKKVGGPIVLHNGGYKIGKNMELYKDLPNLMGVVINKADSLEEALNILKKKVIIGHFSSLLVHELKPNQILDICLKMLEKADRHNNYILMTSEADIPFEASNEQILALIQAPGKYVNEHANIVN